MYIFGELVQPTILSMFDFFSLYLIKKIAQNSFSGHCNLSYVLAVMYIQTKPYLLLYERYFHKNLNYG